MSEHKIKSSLTGKEDIIKIDIDIPSNNELREYIDGFTYADEYVGNASGLIPISNGIVNNSLNADQVDSYDASSTPGANKLLALDSNAQIPMSVLRNLMQRNILDNGGFEIWQRGSGPFGVNGKNTADRWVMQFDGNSTMAVDRDTGNPSISGGDYCLKLTWNHQTTGTSWNIFQELENPKDFYNKTISFSVKVKTAETDSVFVQIYEIGVGQSNSIKHSGNGNWETLTITRTLGTAGTNIQILIIGTKDQIANPCWIDNAMLIVGSEPIDFVLTPPAEEIERCQRYYEQWNNVYMLPYVGSDTEYYFTCPFNTPKYQNPTVTYTTGIPELLANWNVVPNGLNTIIIYIRRTVGEGRAGRSGFQIIAEVL